MVSLIWYLMLLTGIGMFVLQGDAGVVATAMSESAKGAIELLIGLMGIMALWSGMMKICERSGLTEFLARLLEPLLGKVFPGLSKKNPKAMGSIVMNISSNMMGLSNAATPFGVKAMEEMQKINPQKERATDHMVTFLIVNAACIQLLPTTVIAIMAGLGSKNPTAIIVPGMLAAAVALIVGLAADLLLRRFFR